MTARPSTALRACVIGAGSSGIAATKALLEAGIDVDCFERTDRVGGLWVFRGTPETARGYPKTAAYRSLHINTSRRRMQYSDFPMPQSYPDFPSHRDLAAYFDAYVDHFGFRHRIRFDAEVRRAERLAEGGYAITSRGGATLRYDFLLVANGHHESPSWPDPAFPGSFDGETLHSHDFVDASRWAGKRVIVLGMGNSAMDIASEASRVSERVFLAARRGAHIIPKHLFGKPIDEIGGLISPTVPFAVRVAALRVLVRAVVGKMEAYGLPTPDHRLGEAHPTISDEVLSRLAHGEITPKPNIKELRGDSVLFADGSVERADVLVYCTGYKVTFPFFDVSFISAHDNDLPLFRRVFEPSVPDLAFIGLLQPLGAIMPLAEAQGRWVADLMRGRYALPSAEAMRRDMESERATMFARYVASKRHTMQVDFDDYLHALRIERQQGAARAHAARASV